MLSPSHNQPEVPAELAGRPPARHQRLAGCILHRTSHSDLLADGSAPARPAPLNLSTVLTKNISDVQLTSFESVEHKNKVIKNKRFSKIIVTILFLQPKPFSILDNNHFPN
jgi:hypothetical protein